MIENYTALYSPLDIAYNQVMSGPYKERCALGDGELIAAEKEGKITGFWRSAVCVGSDDFQKKSIEWLWSISQDIFYQDFLIDGRISPITKFLLQKGYKVTPYYTQIIDLTKSIEELHVDIRKSYKSLINSEEVEVINDITILKGMHFKARGKTRSDETWKIQQKMMQNEEAICLRCNDSIGLFYTGKIWTYYACGVGEDMHPVIWSAIKHAVYAKRCKFFEMGEQVFSETTEIPSGDYGGVDIKRGVVFDSKLVNISKFKRGWGGATIIRLNLRKDNQ